MRGAGGSDRGRDGGGPRDDRSIARVEEAEIENEKNNKAERLEGHEWGGGSRARVDRSRVAIERAPRGLRSLPLRPSPAGHLAAKSRVRTPSNASRRGCRFFESHCRSGWSYERESTTTREPRSVCAGAERYGVAGGGGDESYSLAR